MVGVLVPLVIQELPSIIAFVKELHRTAHPDDPPITDDEVIAALTAAIASSIAKDDQWLAQHPEGQ